MKQENIPPQKSTLLRKNDSQQLKIGIIKDKFDDIFLINGESFLTERISDSDLVINPKSYYMIINNRNEVLQIKYNQDISNHEVIYDPYKFEFTKKININSEFIKKKYNVPEGYIDTLPKWYSFKFTYPEYNLIFLKPEYGLSIQIHNNRNEFWEILKGKPIVISKNKVNYFVKAGTIFYNPIKAFHSVINPNKEKDEFVVIKEKWNGNFDEADIIRIFNPNQYV
ncbi:MAG: hypothetical protein ACFE9C_00825 [Candidatus Hodarchaeota archaeon]